MSRAVFLSSVILALVAGACGGNSGAAAPPASGGQAAQAPAATPATPGAGQPGASATTPPATAPATGTPAATAEPPAVDPAKATAQAADSLAGATGESSAPAAAAAAVPAATPTPSATAAAATVPPAQPLSPEAARRQAEIDWALKQDEIKNDKNGQWAVEAKASTSYEDAEGTAPFAPSQATGVPNVEVLGNSGMAWATKTPEGGIEWLELKYAKPVFATAVRIRESMGPGAIIKVELYDDKGAPHAVWSGTDPTKALDYLIVQFPKTAYKTDRVRLTLATNIVPGWQEIDAVQLVGAEQAVAATAAAR